MNLHFDFIGPINDDNILCLRNYITSQPEPIERLSINISSLGGTVASGVTIYNYLKSLPFPITTHNLGEVSSCAILLYLAGQIRTAELISKFMFHPIHIGVNGDLPYYKVEEMLKNIDADIKNYSNIVNRETNSLNGLFDIEKCLRSDSIILDSQDAIKYGIITQSFD